MATYYKVVRVNRKGEHYSAITRGRACLRYILGEATVGFEGMPLFLFGCNSDAQLFIRQNRSWVGRNAVVLAGQAGKPRNQTYVCRPSGGLPGFRRFWRGLRSWERQSAPLGTFAADWFKPEQEVA